MKKLSILMLAFVAMTIMSCSGDGDSVKFESNTISYKDEPTLEIVEAKLTMESTERSYGTVTITENHPVLRVTFKVLKKVEEKVIYGNLGFQAYDADGSKLRKLRFYVGSAGDDYEQAKKLGELMNKEIGTTATIKFEGGSYMNSEVDKLDMFKVNIDLKPYTQKQSDDFNKRYSFDSSNDDDDEKSYEEGDEEEDGDSSSSSDSEDWDSVLDSYKEYVDDYISLLKKAKKGDVNALAEYPSILENAQELGEKLQKAKGSMSSSQLSRYTRITNKMTQAIADMK